jgi:hypothetical protein
MSIATKDLMLSALWPMANRSQTTVDQAQGWQAEGLVP